MTKQVSAKTECCSPDLISKQHDAVVGLAPETAADTLGSVSHGVKREEVVLSDLELFPQVLEPRLQESKTGLLV